jgi:toxin ParE1/3/4
MHYRTTALADEDIIELYATGARRFGVAQAERYFTDLVSCFGLLAANKLLARERGEFTPPVRVHFHNSHVIVYLAQDDGILIIRVLDGRQNWEEYLRS